MKRFALFSFETYYPCGGWEDLDGVFPTLEEAVLAFDHRRWDYGHVVDLVRGIVVKDLDSDKIKAAVCADPEAFKGGFS